MKLSPLTKNLKKLNIQKMFFIQHLRRKRHGRFYKQNFKLFKYKGKV